MGIIFSLASKKIFFSLLPAPPPLSGQAIKNKTLFFCSFPYVADIYISDIKWKVFFTYFHLIYSKTIQIFALIQYYCCCYFSRFSGGVNKYYTPATAKKDLSKTASECQCCISGRRGKVFPYGIPL